VRRSGSPHLPALLVAVAALAGCSWSRTVLNDPSTPDRAATVVVGTTTAEELPRILGSNPLSIVEAGEGRRLLVWGYGESKTHALNLVVVAFSRTNTGIDTAYFLVDRDGVVRRKWVGTNSRDLPWEWWSFGD
jgi:hypothetical protein